MTVEEVFEKCLKINTSKRQDYTSTSTVSRNENFHRSVIIVSWFTKDRDKPYAALIGTKMARLGSLLSRDGKPNNESIEDNFADIINYFALWLEDISTKIPEGDMMHEFISKDGSSFCTICTICNLHRSSHTIKENAQTNS